MDHCVMFWLLLGHVILGSIIATGYGLYHYITDWDSVFALLGYFTIGVGVVAVEIFLYYTIYASLYPET